MDKQTTVKEMLKYSGYCVEHNCDNCFGCREQEFANDLADNNFGYIPHAIAEFADFLKDYARQVRENGYDGIGENDIDEKLKEFFNNG